MQQINIFNVRVVFEGDSYGAGDMLTHNKPSPLVEFYDTRYPHTARGQFVARYYASSVMQHKASGLCLYGGVPAWQLGADDMALVRSYVVKNITEKGVAL